jgi:hypothetical protein
MNCLLLLLVLFASFSVFAAPDNANVVIESGLDNRSPSSATELPWQRKRAKN